MAQVVKVTKPTFDVLTETDPRNFIFDSTLNHLKTVQSGSITLTSAGTDVGGYSHGTVSHNLGYVPLTLAYFQDRGTPGVYYSIFSISPAGGDRLSTDVNVGINAGTSDVVFEALSNGGTAGWTTDIQYEIFYEGS